MARRVCRGNENCSIYKYSLSIGNTLKLVFTYYTSSPSIVTRISHYNTFTTFSVKDGLCRTRKVMRREKTSIATLLVDIFASCHRRCPSPINRRVFAIRSSPSFASVYFADRTHSSAANFTRPWLYIILYWLNYTANVPNWFD